MKAARLPELKKELNHLTEKELLAICLRITKYKKENKELLTYLLFEAENEERYIENLKTEVDLLFGSMEVRSIRDTRKGIRRIIRFIDKWVKFSGKKPTAVELRIHFCQQLKAKTFPTRQNFYLSYIYRSQLNKIDKLMPKLHEDLQFDYQELLDEMGDYF
jgi:hypothetical protein